MALKLFKTNIYWLWATCQVIFLKGGYVLEFSSIYYTLLLRHLLEQKHPLLRDSKSRGMMKMEEMGKSGAVADLVLPWGCPDSLPT